MKWIVNNYGKILWTGFVWFGTGTSGQLVQMKLHVPSNVVNFMAACVDTYVWRRKQRDGISYDVAFIYFHLLGCWSKANYLITQIKICRSFNVKNNIEGQFLNRIICLHKIVEFWRTQYQLPTFMVWSDCSKLRGCY